MVYADCDAVWLTDNNDCRQEWFIIDSFKTTSKSANHQRIPQNDKMVFAFFFYQLQLIAIFSGISCPLPWCLLSAWPSSSTRSAGQSNSPHSVPPPLSLISTKVEIFDDQQKWFLRNFEETFKTSKSKATLGNCISPIQGFSSATFLVVIRRNIFFTKT